MKTVSESDGGALMDVLAGVRQQKNGVIVVSFIDSAGTKFSIRLGQEAARDLRDELTDLGESL